MYALTHATYACASRILTVGSGNRVGWGDQDATRGAEVPHRRVQHGGEKNRLNRARGITLTESTVGRAILIQFEGDRGKSQHEGAMAPRVGEPRDW